MNRKKARQARKEEIEIPRLHDSEIVKNLHFNPSEGSIWLGDHRMVLFHVESWRSLRQDLIETVGVEATRGLLTRIGYVAGCRDAELAIKTSGAGVTTRDLFFLGAHFYAIQGILAVEAETIDIDAEKGSCYLEFKWKNSFEAKMHLEANGVSGEPACWMEVGYASGYLSTCMGKRILVKEVACIAMGDDKCACVAQPMEKWGQPRENSKSFVPFAAKESASAEKKGVIGASASFNVTMHKINRVAPTNATVLLLGESGVGKSAFAREVWRQSNRSQKDFSEVNCGAIPEPLMESELFGAERGAYTGAGEARLGRFQAADGGTLFLDEIATLSMTAQGKLLRVIQTGEFEPLGSHKTKKVDVRLIAATNENLRLAVKEGRFREDLFYRLNVFPILVPPLRERRDDIPLLLEAFFNKFVKAYEKPVTGITTQALQLMLGYDWPGNVRELENVIERGVILGDPGQPLGYHHLFSVDNTVSEDNLFTLNELGMLSVSDNKGAGVDPVLETANPALVSWAEEIVNHSSASLFERTTFIRQMDTFDECLPLSSLKLP